MSEPEENLFQRQQRTLAPSDPVVFVAPPEPDLFEGEVELGPNT